MSIDAAKEAAAGLLQGAQDEDQALALAREMIAQQQRQGAAGSVDAPQEADQVAEPESEADEFNPDPELPEYWAADDEPPEIEDVDDEYVPEPDPDEEDEYEDPAVIAERNRRKAAEKKLAWSETQRLTAARKNWVATDGRYVPLVGEFGDLNAIAERSKSRKEFQRLAKAENDRIKALPGVQKFLAARGEKTGPTVEEVGEQWGKPSGGPGLVPSDAAEAQERVAKARKTKGYAGAVTEMFKSGIIKL